MKLIRDDASLEQSFPPAFLISYIEAGRHTDLQISWVCAMKDMYKQPSHTFRANEDVAVGACKIRGTGVTANTSVACMQEIHWAMPFFQWPWAKLQAAFRQFKVTKYRLEKLQLGMLNLEAERFPYVLSPGL